jgi:hypothetical protein
LKFPFPLSPAGRGERVRGPVINVRRKFLKLNMWESKIFNLKQDKLGYNDF